MKNAIKPYYQKKEITKEEYKEIVRKAVEKVQVTDILTRVKLKPVNKMFLGEKQVVVSVVDKHE